MLWANLFFDLSAGKIQTAFTWSISATVMPTTSPILCPVTSASLNARATSSPRAIDHAGHSCRISSSLRNRSRIFGAVARIPVITSWSR